MVSRAIDRHRIVIALRGADGPMTARELTDALFDHTDEISFQHNRGIVSALIGQMIRGGLLRKEGKRRDVTGATVWMYGISPGRIAAPMTFEVPEGCVEHTGGGTVRITAEDPSAIVSELYRFMREGGME